MDVPDYKKIFEREKLDLSVRALNILLQMEIEEFDSFHKFVLKNKYPYNFKSVKNCGKHTANEINCIIKILKEKLPIETEEKSIDPHLNQNSQETLKSNEKPNLLFIDLFKPLWGEFSIDEIESAKLAFYNEEFNLLFSNLIIRSRNILKFLNIDTFISMLQFLKNEKIGFRFHKVQNCGKKSENELNVFLQDIIQFVLLQDESMTNKVNQFKSSLFAIFKEYIFNAKKFNKKEIEILKYRFFLNSNSQPSRAIALKIIADKFNLTKERIRQLETTLPRKIAILTNNVIRDFGIEIQKYFSETYFIIDEEFVKRINQNEDTDFTVSFVILVLTSINKSNYTFFKFKSNKGIFGIAIHKSLQYDFEQYFNYLLEILENPIRKKDILMDLEQLSKRYILKKDHSKYNVVKKIILDFINHWENAELIGNEITLLKNTKLTIYEHIEMLLSEYNKPLHYTQIYNMLRERGHTVTNALNVRSVLGRHSNIFGLKGHGIYGLKKWGGYFGTIGDVAEQYLKLKKKPVGMTELENFICYELIVSQESIREVLFHYAAENRFTKYRDGKVGLKIWDNIQLKMFK